MAEFRQQFFKPGRYHVGGGRYQEFSPTDVQAYVEGTKKLLQSGLGVPVIYEHPDPGSPEGSPRPVKGRWQKNADMVRNTVGWLKDVEVQPDGSAFHVLDIKDPEAASKITNGITKYTSPELRRQFIDGKGRIFDNVFSHVALTNKPRNIDQSQFAAVESEALQFSLEDFEPMPVQKKTKKSKTPKPETLQFADEEVKVEDKPEEPQVEEKQPDDKPEDSAGDEEDVEQTPRTAIDQCVQTLAKLGLILPADTNGGNIIHYIITAGETKLHHEENDKPDEPEEETELVEDKPPLQFSLNEVDSCGNKLLAKVIRQDHEALVGKLNKFPPALRDALIAKEYVHQFSNEGDRLPLLTVSEVVEIFTNNMPANFGVQFSAATKEEQHPQGDAFYTGGDMSKDMAKRIVDEKAKQIPILQK